MCVPGLGIILSELSVSKGDDKDGNDIRCEERATSGVAVKMRLVDSKSAATKRALPSHVQFNRTRLTRAVDVFI